MKIGVLGFAVCKEGHSVQGKFGTPGFIAPEKYEEEEYDEKVDVYAFGICMLEMSNTAYQYSECDDIPIVHKTVIKRIHPEAYAHVSQPLREIIKG